MASYDRGLSPFTQQAQDWDVDRGGAGDSLGPSTSQPELLQPPEHGKVGVLSLGMRFGGFPRQGHNLQGVLEGSKLPHILAPSNPLLIQLRPGEQLPEPLPCSCSLSPGLALLRPPSTFSIHPCIPGCAALPCPALTRGLHHSHSPLAFAACPPQWDVPSGGSEP